MEGKMTSTPLPRECWVSSAFFSNVRVLKPFIMLGIFEDSQDTQHLTVRRGVGDLPRSAEGCTIPPSQLCYYPQQSAGPHAVSEWGQYNHAGPGLSTKNPEFAPAPHARAGSRRYLGATTGCVRWE